MRLRLPLVLLTAVVTFPLAAQNTSRAIQLFRASDWAAAKAEFSAAVKRNDKDARAHYYLGRLALVDDDADAAVDHLEEALKLDDNVADYHVWFAKAHMQQGATASPMKQPFIARRVKSEYERAVALDGKSVDARDGLVDFYAMAPEMMGGGMDKAREQADAIAKLDAMRGHFAAGRIAVRAKDGPTAERELNAAIAAAPDTLRLYTALANWYVAEKAWPNAFATFDRYLKTHPNDLQGAYGIGRVAALSGQMLERGEQSLRAYIKKPPKEAAPPTISLAYLRLGQILEQQGKTADAHSAFEQAVKLDPHNDDAKKALK